MSDPRDVLDRPAPPPTTSVRYGEGREQVVDLWRPVVDPAAPTAGPPDPPDRPAPVIGLIHGGFWRAEYDRHHVRPLANALAAAGYAVAAIEYRRTRRRSPGWPGTVEDVRAALTRLPELVEAAFDRPAGPVLLVGHSAGGHLALWAGSQVTVPGLAGVVSLAGVCDLARAAELRLDDEGDGGAVVAFLGGGPADVPERFAAADPMRLPAPDAAVVLIHGTRDDVVPIELSRRYADHVGALGHDADLVELDGIEHFGLIDPLSPAYGALRAALGGLTGRPAG